MLVIPLLKKFKKQVIFFYLSPSFSFQLFFFFSPSFIPSSSSSPFFSLFFLFTSFPLSHTSPLFFSCTRALGMEQRFSIDSCGQSVVRIQRWVRHEGVKEKKSGDGAECLEFQHLRQRTRRENTVSVCGSDKSGFTARAGLIQTQD